MTTVPMRITILTHELDYVSDFLIDEYYKTLNPFKRKKMRKIMNKLHRYMYPNTGDLFQERQSKRDALNAQKEKK